MEIRIVVNPPKDKENTVGIYSITNIDTKDPLIPNGRPDLVVFNLGEASGTDIDSMKALDLLFRTSDSPERNAAL